MHHPIDRIPHTTAIGTPVVEHWFISAHNLYIKGCGMHCPVYWKVQIADPLLLMKTINLFSTKRRTSNKQMSNKLVWCIVVSLDKTSFKLDLITSVE